LRLVVEHHLAMAQISQRRDLDDPTVIQNFARIIQSPGNLVMLTLHTLADSLGTSDQLWNGFKDALLWRLYQKANQVLSGGTEFQIAEARQRELLVQEVKRMAPPSFEGTEIQAHFNNLPPRYCQITEAKDILEDVLRVHRFLQLQLSEGEVNPLVPIINWYNERDRGYTTVKLCTWDRERFFTNINGCFTAAGFNILGAEILTRFDGIILDSFFVTDAKTGQLPKKEEREKFELLVQKILTGATLDLHALITKVRPAPATYKSLDGERIPTLVELDNATSATRTIVDLQAEDRVGLLYDVSRALADLNLSVHLAKILTEKGAAIDTFYIAEKNGLKVLDPERQKAIKKRLHQAAHHAP
jgi:[protein-PII] uridylyltransferase